MVGSTSTAVENGARLQRIQWIDALKGLGILMIFVGHIWSLDDPSVFYKWMYAFHVPLFFFVSGITLKPNSGRFGSIAGKKARTILVPYFFYAFLGYLFFAVGYFVAQLSGRHVEQFDYGFMAPLLGIFHGTLGDGFLINSPLWFLPTLFLSFLMGYLINSHIASHGLRLVVVGVLAAVGIVVGESIRIPFGLVPALIALVFFQAGYYFKSCEACMAFVERTGMWGVSLALGLFAVSLLAPINGFIGVGKGIVNNPAFFLFFAFVGIALSVLVVQRDGFITTWLAFVGRRSLSILVIHMLIIKSVKVLMIVIWGFDLQTIDGSVVLGMWVLVISSLLLVPSVYIMERWLPWTLGRFPLRRGPTLTGRA